MIQQVDISDIDIKEINLKSTSKGIFVVCKYTENGVEKSLKDSERALSQFYEILNELKMTGIRNLDFPEYYRDRIIITGARFKYKDYVLEECRLLGLYKVPTSPSIEINFYPWLYKATDKYGYTENDIKLLNGLQKQAKLYAKGVREQIPLYQEKKSNEDE